MTDKEKRELKDGVISIFKRFNILDHTATIGGLRDDILRYINSLQEETELSHQEVTKKCDKELTEFEKELISYRYGCEALSVLQGEHLLEVKKEADYFLSLARKQFIEEACEFLAKWDKYHVCLEVHKDFVIEDFKKAMSNEK